MATDDEPPIITIKRDYQSHRWIYTQCGAHGIQTPFVDDCAAEHVVRWLKDCADGKLKIKVDLS